MPGYFPPRKRNVVPRWRSPELTAQLGELRSSQREVTEAITDQREFDRACAEWRLKRSPSSAAEVIEAALVCAAEDRIRDAAAFLISAGQAHPGLPLRAKIARSLLEPAESVDACSTTSLQPRIHQCRSLLALYPRNALRWVDLALAYTSAALPEKALRCLKVALALEPNNRYVLRSTVRFYLHVGKGETAYHLLQRSPVVLSDPWLMAAELAVAGVLGRSPDSVKDVRNLLKSGHFSDHDTSELASQFATFQYAAGKRTEARRLLGSALISPTDNSVAQCQWLSGMDESLTTHQRFQTPPRNFEADALREFFAGNWRKTIDEAWKWYNDEPFARRPTVLGSYITGDILENYEESIRFADLGLRSHPGDPALLNNLAYALAQMSELGKAKDVLERLHTQQVELHSLVPALATAGLVAYREGNAEQGRALYEEAIDKSRGADMSRLKQMALLHLALEEIRANAPDALRCAHRALDESAKADTPDLIVMRNRLTLRLQAKIT